VVAESQRIQSGSHTVQKLLKPSQVAERLQVSVWSVYRRSESGELPAVRIGTGPRAPIRVDADELHQFPYGQGTPLNHRREQALPLRARKDERRTRAWR
jgi:excisionase family DNA binding protein